MEEQIVKNITERPNSFEVGKAGARWKLYFNSAEDLTKQIEKLQEAGFDILVQEKEEKCAKDTVPAVSS